MLEVSQTGHPGNSRPRREMLRIFSRDVRHHIVSLLFGSKTANPSLWRPTRVYTPDRFRVRLVRPAGRKQPHVRSIATPPFSRLDQFSKRIHVLSINVLSVNPTNLSQ